MHTGICSKRAGRQLHSESTKECIQSPSWGGGQGLSPTLVLTVRSSSPPIALLAARGRGGQHRGLCRRGGSWGQLGGDGEGNASLVRCPGAREAVLGARGWGEDWGWPLASGTWGVEGLGFAHQGASSLTWPINDACSEPGYKQSFSLDGEYWVAPKRTQWIYGTSLWPWLSPGWSGRYAIRFPWAQGHWWVAPVNLWCQSVMWAYWFLSGFQWYDHLATIFVNSSYDIQRVKFPLWTILFPV